MNTIAAVSTPAGAGGIGIIRVSGKDARAIADAVFVCRGREKGRGAADALTSSPMTMIFGDFVAEDFRDRGYAVFFPADRAYTGEDTVEFYLHGGVRIMRGALEECLKKGARAAERGEFTRRAFLAGRMDLADAEGVADMINAESAAGLRAAYRLMDGSVSRRINLIADRLLSVMTGLEAVLDYPEETEDEVLPPLEGSVREALADSLFNALLGDDRAIVTPVAGTTRDTVEGSVECDGVRINFVDTAGLRDSSDAVESEGIARARKAAAHADVVLRVVDTVSEGRGGGEYEDYDAPVLTVLNKCDLTSYACPRRAGWFAVSAKEGIGVPELRRAIASLMGEGLTQGGELITSERHISALYRAKNALEAAIRGINDTPDCILVCLREAYDALGEITGSTATQAVVDSVFEKFCVGK